MSAVSRLFAELVAANEIVQTEDSVPNNVKYRRLKWVLFAVLFAVCLQKIESCKQKTSLDNIFGYAQQTLIYCVNLYTYAQQKAIFCAYEWGYAQQNPICCA